MSALLAPQIFPLRAFEGYGIEIEYMIVDRRSFSVLPIVDWLALTNGSVVEHSQIRPEAIEWSNELVSHLIELKNSCPTSNLKNLRDGFQATIRSMNQRLQLLDACLMPTAMHPWMDPRSETRLWTSSDAEIYETFDRIFDCKTHGWANLQSVHVNLPFGDDEEFASLHAAIRLVLPIIPAIAASSPIVDGAATGLMDSRIDAYRKNAAAFPSITGQVIPETVSNRNDYEERILAPMYREIAPLDTDGKLQYEWLNSRGAIARFDRNAIEIRLIDAQECPAADIAIATVVIDLIKMLHEQHFASFALQQSIETEALLNILLECAQHGEDAIIRERAYLELFCFPNASCTAMDLWRHLARRLQAAKAGHVALWVEPLTTIFNCGTLARRILGAVGSTCMRDKLRVVYQDLSKCLHEGRMYTQSPGT
jgi:glutamate---cysteine ligase / carboxylate-amine ligase